ncbi:MAG: hypothetical protein ABIG42_04855 [bacterium]
MATILYKPELGINGRSHLIFKIDGFTRGISLTELLLDKIEMNKWVPMNELFGELCIYSEGNKFVEVESTYCRDVVPGEEFIEVDMGSCRSVILTRDYPCAVIDRGMKCIARKDAGDLKVSDRIAMHRRLQFRLPHEYYKGVEESFLTRKLHEDDNFKNNFVSGKMKTLSIISGESKIVYSETQPDGEIRSAFVKYTDELEPIPIISDIKLFRLKLKSDDKLPKILTAGGILLYA